MECVCYVMCYGQGAFVSRHKSLFTTHKLPQPTIIINVYQTGKEKMTAHSSHSATHVAEEEKIIVVGRQSGQRRWSDTHTLDLKTKKVR